MQLAVDFADEPHLPYLFGDISGEVIARLLMRNDLLHGCVRLGFVLVPFVGHDAEVAGVAQNARIVQAVVHGVVSRGHADWQRVLLVVGADADVYEVAVGILVHAILNYVERTAGHAVFQPYAFIAALAYRVCNPEFVFVHPRLDNARLNVLLAAGELLVDRLPVHAGPVENRNAYLLLVVELEFLQGIARLLSVVMLERHEQIQVVRIANRERLVGAQLDDEVGVVLQRNGDVRFRLPLVFHVLQELIAVDIAAAGFNDLVICAVVPVWQGVQRNRDVERIGVKRSRLAQRIPILIARDEVVCRKYKAHVSGVVKRVDVDVLDRPCGHEAFIALGRQPGNCNHLARYAGAKLCQNSGIAVVELIQVRGVVELDVDLMIDRLVREAGEHDGCRIAAVLVTELASVDNLLFLNDLAVLLVDGVNQRQIGVVGFD